MELNLHLIEFGIINFIFFCPNIEVGTDLNFVLSSVSLVREQYLDNQCSQYQFFYTLWHIELILIVALLAVSKFYSCNTYNDSSWFFLSGRCLLIWGCTSYSILSIIYCSLEGRREENVLKIIFLSVASLK